MRASDRAAGGHTASDGGRGVVYVLLASKVRATYPVPGETTVENVIRAEFERSTVPLCASRDVYAVLEREAEARAGSEYDALLVCRVEWIGAGEEVCQRGANGRAGEDVPTTSIRAARSERGGTAGGGGGPTRSNCEE